MLKYPTKFLYLLLTIVLFFGCNLKKGIKKPNTHKIKIDFVVNRFEKDLFAMDTNHIVESLESLDKKYPQFYPVFVAQILQATAKPKDYASYAPLIKEFISLPSMRGLYDTVQDIYGNFKPFEKELQSMLTYYKYYFPKEPTPQIYTCISEFVQGAFTYEKNILGLGLDLHLGANYRYYPALEIPSFVIKKLEPKYLVINAANVLATNILDDPTGRGKLLDQMIYHGKIAYFKQMVLPDRKEEDILLYSKKDLKWCEDNEKEIWSFFLENDLLFNVRQNEYYKYVQDGPTTYGMPQGAPSRVGAWVGFQIVKQYMQYNADISIPQLFAEKNAQKMLEESRYKPKRR